MNDNITLEEIPQTENNSYYVVAESKILEDARLTDELLVTFLHLSNFLRRDGYATCSDEWLAEKRRCKIRNVQYHLEALEKAGYLWRETWKEGMYWKRRIWLSSKYAQYLIENQLEDEEFKKCLRDAKNCVIQLQNFAPSNRKKLRHNNKSTEQKKKTTTPTLKAPALSLSLFEKMKKIFKEIPDEKIHKAVKGYEEATKRIHIESPEGWIREAIEKEWKFPPTKEEKISKHKAITKWIVTNIQSNLIYDGPTYLEFISGGQSPSVVVDFTDSQFEEKCLKELQRKRLIGTAEEAPWKCHGKELNT